MFIFVQVSNNFQIRLLTARAFAKSWILHRDECALKFWIHNLKPRD